MSCPAYAGSKYVGALNCSYDAQSSYQAQYDADISGIGVVIGFISTPIITLVALLFGYISNSLPSGLLNEVDYRIIQKLRRVLRMKPLPDEENELEQIARIGREDAYRAFIIALSDQQLVTGLAMLIAGYSRHCTITTYSFTIVGAYGWLSATTHLSAVLLLSGYHRQYPRVRDMRVFLMVCSAAMLLVSMVIQLSTTWWDGMDILFQCSLNHFSLQNFDPFTTLRGLFVIFFLIKEYVVALISLYTRSHDYIELDVWFTKKVAKRYGVRPDDIKDYQGRLEKAVNKIYRKQSDPIKKRLELERCALWFLFFEYQDSALSKLMALLFGNIYGIGNLLVNRADGSIWGIGGNSNDWGFGQIVPILLFLLPLFAASESYFETQKKKKDAQESASLKAKLSRPSSPHTISEDLATSSVSAIQIPLENITPQQDEGPEDPSGPGEEATEKVIGLGTTEETPVAASTIQDDLQKPENESRYRYHKRYHNNPRRQDTEDGGHDPKLNQPVAEWPLSIAQGNIYATSGFKWLKRMLLLTLGYTPRFRWLLFWMLVYDLPFTVTFALWNVGIGDFAFQISGIVLLVFSMLANLWILLDSIAVAQWIRRHRKKANPTK